MADEHDVTAEWQVEEIPDHDDLLRAVHECFRKRDGTISPGAFKNQEGGMSTDWSKYSTAEQTRQIRKEPEKNAVVRMNVGRVRDIPEQRVVHTPDATNRAHTDVEGIKDAEVRVLLRREAVIEIPFGRANQS